MEYDILIIGAGITGCMIAHKLARYRLRTAVVERCCDIAMGATGANSAIAHAGYDPAPGTLKAALNAKGAAQLPAITRQLDVGYKQIGSLVVAFGEDEMDGLRRLARQGEQNGVPELALLDRARLRELEPNISENAYAALYAPTGGIVCPYGLAIAAAEHAAVNGTDFYFDFPVRSITRAEGGFTVGDGQRTLRARIVINAAGTHADEMASLAGERDFPAVSTPRRGEYMLLDKSMGSLVRHTLFVLPGKLGKGILLSPTVDGNLIVGPNSHAVPKDDTATTAAGLAEVAAGASRLVRSLNTRTVITQFAGVRPNCVLDDFYIAPSEQIPGLLHAAGIESPGLASSPAVADYVLERLRDMGVRMEERDDYLAHRPPQLRFRELSDEQKRAVIAENPAYGKVICRCETITEGEILDAIRRPLGARTLDMVKRRTRAGMGRCQGGFCSPRVTDLLARELGIPLDAVTKRGGDSFLLTGPER